MQITQVELENVKSYQRASIAFTGGTNAICGPNGAGKSTLLESIGFALFDVLPYPQSQFVREGEKTATITVHLVGSDGRPYQVVRRCGSRTQYYVYDPEIEQKLTTTKSETVEWLYEFLGVEESSDLAVLFKDAVGVPQGLLTAAFLLSPALRKSTFDPLLRVDEYKRVWNALLEPRRHLEGQIAAEEKRIAAFEAEVKALPGWQARAADLQAGVQSDEVTQKAKGAELADVTRRKAELEAVKERLDALEKSATQAEGRIRALAAQLTSAQTAVEQAEAAQAVVDETKAGHQAYLLAQANLEKLEGERKERDGLRAAVHEQTTGLALAEQRVEALESQLEGITTAEAEVEALRPQVETQEHLEVQLGQAQRAADRLADEERGLTQEKERLTTLHARLVQVRTDLEELARAEDELGSLRGDLTALDERWEELRVQIAGRQSELSQLEEQARRADGRIAAAEGLLRQEQSKLAGLEDRLSQVQEGLAELATVVAENDTLRSELVDLNTQHQELASQAAAHQAKMDQVQTQIDVLEAAEAALCPVCEGPLTPEHRAQLLARNRAHQEELAAALGGAQAGLAEVARAQQQKQESLAALEQRARELPRPGEGDEATAQIEAQREAVDRSKASLAGEQAEAKAHEQRREVLAAALARLRPQADEAQNTRDQVRQGIEARETRLRELPRPAEEEELSARIEDLQARVKELESAVAELATAPALVERLEAELAALGDPRRDLQRAADIAGQRAGAEKILAATKGKILELQARIGAIERDLAAHTGLDKRLEAERQTLETEAADHQRYLGHIREAESLPERWGRVETLGSELGSAQAERERLVLEWDETAAGYDAGTYATLTATFQALRDELATLEERLRLQRVQLGEAEGEIERLAAVQNQLEASRDEHGTLTGTQALLGRLRQVLRDAGPKVTQALVVAISQQAARLYADIMADHTARLQWTEDYEILLTTGGRERTFQQLSGGEQMASALAVRLALLREVSDIDVAFFDEPTANLDDQRRDNLAEQILHVKGLSQLFVISHDDTFERDTDHVIRVVKEHGVSRVGSESVEGVEA